jgi:hypothetical protein
MANLILNGSTSGSITLSSPAVSGTTTLTLPTTSGTVITTASTFGGTGPAFSAYAGSNQSISASTFTKVQCNTEEFDTNSNYNTTDYRFTPTVAGYYQITVGCAFTTTQTAELLSTVYKNGSRFKTVFDMEATSWGSYGTVLVYANGTTDYFEFFIYSASTGTRSISGNARDSYFQAAMVRSA